jgi:pimeloyl-ACP methyl ester carboxylesterase
VAISHALKSTNGRFLAPWPLRAGLSALGAVSPALAARAGARLFLTPPRHGVPRREAAALSSAEPFALRHRGHALRGWTLGGGPAVLLVHGWGGRSGQLAPIAHALAAAGCTAVAFDAPAHGRSGGRTTSMVGIADAAAEVAARFGARAAVGHSVGGAAIAFATANGLDLAAAALVSPPRTPAAFVDAAASALGLSRSVRSALDERLARQVGVRLEAVDVARCAPESPPPFLVVHDEQDDDVPLAAGAEVADAWRARLVVTSGLGHRRILRDASVVSEVVAFVTSPLPRCGCGRLAEPDGSDGVPRCLGCTVADDLWDRGRRQARIAAGPTA